MLEIIQGLHEYFIFRISSGSKTIITAICDVKELLSCSRIVFAVKVINQQWCFI